MHTPAPWPPEPRTEPDAWWEHTLDTIEADLDALAHDFCDRIAQTVPGYHRVAGDDLFDTALQVLQVLIHSLRGTISADELQQRAGVLGARRFHQGIELDYLLDAIRLDYRVLWAALTRCVDAAQAPLLLGRAEHVLQAVEQYSRLVQTEYMREQARQLRVTQSSTRAAFAQFMSAEDPAHDLHTVAEMLRVSRDERLHLVLTVDDPLGGFSHALLASVAALPRPNHHVFQWETGPGSVHIFTGDSWPAHIPAVTPASVRAGTAAGVPHRDSGRAFGITVTGVDGLVCVPEAIRNAQQLAPFARRALARPGAQRLTGGDADEGAPLRLLPYESGWIPYAHEQLAELFTAAHPRSLAGLDEVSASEAKLLIETVLTYCQLGSVKDTAAELFVHRNTVLNRLRHFHALTGLDVTVPLAAAEALIALGVPLTPRL